MHEGRRYESKPILAAAHGYEHPDVGPLRSSEFSGGRPTVTKLEQLGFEVERLLDAPVVDGPAAGPLLSEFIRFVRPRERGNLQGGSHPAAEALKRVAEAFQERLPVSIAEARVKASVRQGNSATVPWIAVLDPRETNTTQHGTYPVLLIPEDLRGVYLTLAQGVTPAEARSRQGSGVRRSLGREHRHCVLVWHHLPREASATAMTALTSARRALAVTTRRR